jgi:aspartyl aminopeptidase
MISILICQATSDERVATAMLKSMLISADMAHAIHPNYAEKHEELHRPRINSGVVIKQNANQRYATTSITSLILKEAAKRCGETLQEFVVRVS